MKIVYAFYQSILQWCHLKNVETYKIVLSETALIKQIGSDLRFNNNDYEELSIYSIYIIYISD